MSKEKSNNNLKNKIDKNSLKYEVAKELGLSDKIDAYGWKSLTSRESGKIGGYITKKKLAQKNLTNQNNS